MAILYITAIYSEIQRKINLTEACGWRWQSSTMTYVCAAKRAAPISLYGPPTQSTCRLSKRLVVYDINHVLYSRRRHHLFMHSCTVRSQWVVYALNETMMYDKCTLTSADCNLFCRKTIHATTCTLPQAMPLSLQSLQSMLTRFLDQPIRQQFRMQTKCFVLPPYCRITVLS